MESIDRLGFTLSFFLLQSLFIVSNSSPQRHLLQLSSRPTQKLQIFPSTAIPAFTNIPPFIYFPPPVSTEQASAPSNSNRGNITAAIAGTAVSSFALSGILFLVFHRFTAKKRRDPDTRVFSSDGAVLKPEPTLDSVIVENNILDALRCRNIGDSARRLCNHCNSVVKGVFHYEDDEAVEVPEDRHFWPVADETKPHEMPLLLSDSVTSTSPELVQSTLSSQKSSISITSLETVSHAPAMAAIHGKSLPPSPPPPPAPRKSPTPPALPLNRNLGPPPPHQQSGNDDAMERPRLKPLHWDKVNPARSGHSMVWDRINNGSLKFDDDQMDALFGYVTTSRNPPISNAGESSSVPSAAAVPTQIFLLDARKSQNTAIILRTLALSRQEILDGLRNGHGLAADTLEKLSRIAPTKDEELLILSFTGNPVQLADAESFLFHLLRTFPSAFSRIAAMHFRSSVYGPEIFHLKQSLRTLEQACKELRSSGLFLKLLEAVLNAGNRMNAGTERGNAMAFDLASLHKLSDVKSTDGNTTLLHFVVEEVVRSEGKRCYADSHGDNILWNTTSGEAPITREDRVRVYMMLGLPIVGGLSVEFTNVRAAASLDYDYLLGTCSTMAERIMEIRQMLMSCAQNGEGFVTEMKDFVVAAAMEIEELREEQGRVVEIVKRTMEYFRPGAAAKEKAVQPPLLRLFVIVRDFLTMVDQACIHISRNIQRRKKQQSSLASGEE